MAKKLKITKGMNYDKLRELDKKNNDCLACAGSGWYDDYDFVNNRPIPCGACDGTGRDK